MNGLGKQIEICISFSSYMNKLLTRSKLTFMEAHMMKIIIEMIFLFVWLFSQNIGHGFGQSCFGKPLGGNWSVIAQIISTRWGHTSWSVSTGGPLAGHHRLPLPLMHLFTISGPPVIVSWVSQRMSWIYNKFMPSRVKITVISFSLSFEIITPQNFSTHTISQVETNFSFCVGAEM
jgi:hypothetical protein